MELKDAAHTAPDPSVLSEVFAVTEGNGQSATERALAVQKLHARLASSEFVAQMTRIFFAAKRAALAQSK